MKQDQVSILPNAHGKEENVRKRTDRERGVGLCGSPVPSPLRKALKSSHLSFHRFFRCSPSSLRILMSKAFHVKPYYCQLALCTITSTTRV